MNKLKRLAVIGASYLQLPLIEKAKEMGIETHVFAWKANAVGEKEADFFYPISIREKEEILDQCQKIGIDGITSIASDLAMTTVNFVAYKMGLVGNSIKSNMKSTNKYEMRKAFAHNGDPSPQFITIDDMDKWDGMEYPFIVKPVDRSGSRGVTKVANEDELIKAVKEAEDESFEKKAIIEEYVEGKEYSVESISYKGKHWMLAITEKFTTGEPNYIETGHLEPAQIDEVMAERIKNVIFHALDSLEIKYGASHSEIKINEKEEITIIEIGARMGGDLIGSELVRYSTGIDFVRAVIDIAVGNEPILDPITDNTCRVKSKYILTWEDVEEYRKIERDEPERILKTVNINTNKIGGFSNSSERKGGVYIVKC